MRNRLNEKRADQFDLRLYALMEMAASYGVEGRSAVNLQWDHIASALAGIRPNVRAMMHEKDREATNA